MTAVDETAILTELADWLEEAGFQGYDETIEEWIEEGRDAWPGGVLEMLGALRKTVWQDFANVGEVPYAWLDDHPRPEADDFEDWIDYEDADRAWRDAARQAA